MDKSFKYPEAQAKDFNDTERSFVACASDESIDRDGEILMADGWDLKNFKSNPVVMLSHNYMGGRESLPVGKAKWIRIKDKRLIFQPEFAPTPAGQEVYDLYKGGYLNAFSVGFKPIEVEHADGDGVKKPRRIYRKQELLEISVVAIPSNPRALVEARAKGLIKTKEFNAIVDEMLADKTCELIDTSVTISKDYEAMIAALTKRIEELEQCKSEIIIDEPIQKIDAVSKTETPAPTIDTEAAVASVLTGLIVPITIKIDSVRDAVKIEYDTHRGKVR